MAAVSLLVQQNLTRHLRPRVFHGLMCRIRPIYNCARCTLYVPCSAEVESVRTRQKGYEEPNSEHCDEARAVNY